MEILKTKLIKPNIRFKNFNDSWKEISLSELLRFKNGINASKEDYGSGYKFINVLDIIENNFILNDSIQGSVNVSRDIYEKNLVEYGDILFQRSSETREDVGQSNVYLDKENNATFGGFVIRGKKIAAYDPFFLHLSLKTSTARKEITSKSGGSTRYNVGQSTLSEVKLYLPEIKEQQKIASFLSAVDKRIDLLEQKKARLNKYKKGVMQHIFSREIRFKDDNGKEFTEWSKKQLGDICKKESSNVSANSLEGKSGKYKVYGATGYLQSVDFYNHEGPYISIVKDGAGVGRTLLCDGYSSVLGTLDVIKPKADTNLNFIYYQLNSIRFTKYITGSTIPHIYFKDYSKEKLLIPCSEEQNKIAGFLTSIDIKIELVEKQIEGSNQFKKGLLQKMFV